MVVQLGDGWLAALNKVVHRNNCRTKYVVITAEHPKGLCPSWHGLVIQCSKYSRRMLVTSPVAAGALVGLVSPKISKSPITAI